MYAVISPAQKIMEVFKKILPTYKLKDGYIIVKYNPPAIDHELVNAVPIEPVTGNQVLFNIVPKPADQTTPVIIKRKTNLIQSFLDKEARGLGYDNILSAVTYASTTDPRFGNQGILLKQWRAECWATAYDIMDDVQNGLRPIPTDAELLAEMPAKPQGL